jgi:hypothetical protein
MTPRQIGRRIDVEEDTEAGIHARISGTDGKAGKSGPNGWRGSKRTGLIEQTLRNWVNKTPLQAI